MRAGTVFSGVALLLGCLGPGAAMSDSQIAQDVSDTVWCYDEERALVTRKPDWKCAGRIIGESEARKIRLQRIRRIQGLI